MRSMRTFSFAYKRPFLPITTSLFVFEAGNFALISVLSLFSKIIISKLGLADSAMIYVNILGDRLSSDYAFINKTFFL